MTPALNPEMMAKLAGYIVNRRDKRIITFSVLIAYGATLVGYFVAPLFGKTLPKEMLDSIEVLAGVVVVSHIMGGVAQRHIARKTAEDAAAAPAKPGEETQ